MFFFCSIWRRDTLSHFRKLEKSLENDIIVFVILRSPQHRQHCTTQQHHYPLHSSTEELSISKYLVRTSETQSISFQHTGGVIKWRALLTGRTKFPLSMKKKLWRSTFDVECVFVWLLWERDFFYLSTIHNEIVYANVCACVGI